MILLFLRDGKSDPPDSLPDEQRQLRDEGRRQLRAAATTWRRLGVRPEVVLTSPRQRSIDSAGLFARGLELDREPTVVDELAPGARWDAFATLLERHADAEAVAFVGHEPDLSRAIEHLTGASSVRLGEGGLCVVELEDRPAAGAGTLTLLLDPAVYGDA